MLNLIRSFLSVFSDEEWKVPGDTEDPEDYQAKSKPFSSFYSLKHKMISFFNKRGNVVVLIVYYGLFSSGWPLLICVVWRWSTNYYSHDVCPSCSIVQFFFIASRNEKFYYITFTFSFVLVGCTQSQVREKNCLNGGRCQKRVYEDGRKRLVCLCRVSGFSGHIGNRCERPLVPSNSREVN